MTSNLKAVQNAQHSSPISLVWVREIRCRSQTSGTDLECPEVAFGKYRVTCGRSDWPRALLAQGGHAMRCTQVISSGSSGDLGFFGSGRRGSSLRLTKLFII